jgi:predicted Rossmann fold nucleotide-binding protein DprA/Smf involved in DNA uptake
VGLLEDAELVYEALTRRSPQDVRELARTTGIGGESLQMAVVWLELRGRVERHFDIDEERTRSFSSVRVKELA